MDSIVVCKACIKTGLEICGGVPGQGFIDLMANVFTKLKSKGLGDIPRVATRGEILTPLFFQHARRET